MKLALRHTEEQLQNLVNQERRADECNRLRAVLFAKQGFTAPEIATCTGFSRRTVQEWVARYNRQGVAGLETRPGRGRKGPLSAVEIERLKQRIEAGPLPADGVCTLRGLDIKRILLVEFGKLRSLSAVYGLLHRLGYSSLVPRPQHPQSDPAAQEDFKKSSASDSQRSKLRIPTARCRSSTKTKRGSGNRAH